MLGELGQAPARHVIVVDAKRDGRGVVAGDHARLRVDHPCGVGEQVGGTRGYGARHHVRRNNLQYLHQEIPLTKKRGSFTLEESLLTLIRNGDIEREDAQLCAIHPDDLNILLKSSAAHS